ncbi:lantibiotic dehydratase [Streptomyces sp. NPDC058052]|uniref:lantibiotic dehydratase n=1 Tax=Streptomyces sp. NPDC058052 TaxID=3346316 RepID=UPI0036E64120
MYDVVDAAAVRAAAWEDPGCRMVWPDLTSPDAGPEGWRAWLCEVWATGGFASAVTTASPDLGARVGRILDGHLLPAADIRRVVLAVLRYLLRASGRATPFGRFAGVAAACLGSAPELTVGGGHHAVARPDAETVNALVSRLEQDPEIRPHLRVVTSVLAVERDGYVVIEHRPATTSGGGADLVKIRLTSPVQAAMDHARCPIRWDELTERLSAGFPRAAADAVDGLLAGLVEQRVLLTELRPPMTAPEPAAEISTRVRAYAPQKAESVGSVPRRAVDLRVDWDLTIPEAVTREAKAVALVLARLAPRAALSGWAEWHRRFLEWYGPRAVVSVLDAIDALGYPSGYRGASDLAPAALTDRDEHLLELAYRAALQRRREVVLDDEMVDKLAATRAEGPVQPTTELTVRIHAASLPALKQGAFTMHVTGVARAAGTTTGRFLHVLPKSDRHRMSEVYASLPGLHRGSVLAQISSPPLSAQGQNVARAPRATRLVIPVGDYAAPETEILPVTDLAVTADATQLHLVSLTRGRPVHTLLLNAVDLTRHTHPLARFLAEAPVALATPCTGFQWGTAASALPFLPALRYGRTVLSPARWRLADTDLAAPTAPWPLWDASLQRWRHETGLPTRVYLSEADQTLPLDLAEPAHRAVLRAHLDRHRRVTLRPSSHAMDLGWTGGRAHEVVIPLVADQRIAPVPTTGGHVASRDLGQLPGCGDRLYLRLHGHRDRQDSILIRHLPDLLRELDGPPWWFIRYHDPADHLRLRLTCTAGTLGEAVETAGEWARRLRHRGLITHLTADTHLPETARFGGPGAIAAAEAYFATDSAAVVAQLAVQSPAGPDARALAAASMADIATGLLGDTRTAMDWLIEHTRTHAPAPPRAVYRQAVDLAHGTPEALGENIAAAWAERRATLSSYRGALRDSGMRPQDVLADLLHLHHVRMRGPGLDAERGHLHLARAAALSWTAQSRNNA